MAQDIKDLERQLQKKQYQKWLYNTIKDTFGLGIKEFSKTTSKIFAAPTKGKNQITPELEKYEEKIILDRKDNTNV